MQTPGDIVWSFLIRLLFCTHKFALNLQRKTKVQETGFYYIQVIKIADV